MRITLSNIRKDPMALKFNICDTLHNYDDVTMPESTGVKPTVKSILKTVPRRETPSVCPDPCYFTFNFREAPNKLPDAGCPYYTKKVAIAWYQQREEGVIYPANPPRYTFFNTRVAEFEKLACSGLKPAGIEMVKESDPLECIAAFVLDCLIANQEKGKALDLMGILFDRLNRYNRTFEEKRTIQELKTYVREQTQDLIERCEERVTLIPKIRQFGSLDELTKFKTYWTWDEEAVLAEKLLTRIPDVLTQRFLTKRVYEKVAGLDATDEMLRILRDVIMPALV